MAKNRKTRKQKLISDLRYKEPTSFIQTQQPEKKEMPKAFTYNSSAHLSGTTNTTVLTQDYQHVTRDLLKTAIATGVIVILELILFFSTKGFS